MDMPLTDFVYKKFLTEIKEKTLEAQEIGSPEKWPGLF